MGWWRFTRSAIEALTTPPADVAGCDRAVLGLARDSLIGAGLHRASSLVQQAWYWSRARTAFVWMQQTLQPDRGPSAFRIRGWIAVVTGATILLLQAVKPTPVGPLSSLVPLLMIAAGALLMLAADPVARASADRRSRCKAS